MAKILLLILLFTLHPNLRAEANQRSRICLNMIVKNEAHVIERCLESTLPLIDSWVIVDTGSTDGTQEIIRNFFEHRKIPGSLFERPWVDFAYNRNEALELGKPNADYLLFIDADDIFSYDSGYVRPEIFDREGYYARISLSGMSYIRPILVNTQFSWQWQGVVHEAIHCPEVKSYSPLTGVTMQILGGGDRSRNPDKYRNDAALLEEDLRKYPDNSRTVFYLAQSYQDAGELEKAIEWYKVRAEMGNGDEEVFFSLYQIACIQDKLALDQDTVLSSYSKAFLYRPIRAEPLYKTALYYLLHGDPLRGYQISSLALKIPEPRDFIFVESSVYDFWILFTYSLCAFHIGAFQDCLNASLKLLAKNTLPIKVRSHIEHNMATIMQIANQHLLVQKTEKE